MDPCKQITVCAILPGRPNHLGVLNHFPGLFNVISPRLGLTDTEAKTEPNRRRYHCQFVSQQASSPGSALSPASIHDRREIGSLSELSQGLPFRHEVWEYLCMRESEAGLRVKRPCDR